MAEQSEVIQALTSGFLLSLWPDDPPEVVHRRARWLVRVLTSLLIFPPGRDAEDERAILEEFVVPMVCPPSETEVKATTLRTDRDSST